MIGTLALALAGASCATKQMPQYETQSVDLTRATYVQTISTRSDTFKLYITWFENRQYLGEVEPRVDRVYKLDIPNGTLMQAELHFENGYKCATFPLMAYSGNVVTLRMNGNELSPGFCIPVEGSKGGPPLNPKHKLA